MREAPVRPGRPDLFCVGFVLHGLSVIILASIGIAVGCNVSRTPSPGPTHTSAGDECIAWQARLARLPPSLRDTYRANGVAWAGDALLVSEVFVPDCRMQLKVADYFGSVIRGRVTAEQREWAATESGPVCGILDEMWEFLGSAGDGAFGFEKYALLGGDGLLPSDLGPVVARIIRMEGTSLGLVSAIAGDRLPGVEVALQEARGSARLAGDAVGEVYALAALQAYGLDPLADLERMQARPGLTEPMRTVLAQILVKVRRAGRLTFSDLEDVEYAQVP